MNGENDHARLYFVEHIREAQGRVVLMDIGQPITEFYFRRYGNKRQVKVEANASLKTKIISFQL